MNSVSIFKLSTTIILLVWCCVSVYPRKISFALDDSNRIFQIGYKNDLKNCEDIEESIKLPNMNLKEISKKFIVSSHVTALSLRNNNLTLVPDHVFDNLPNLECLNLENNTIQLNEFLLMNVGKSYRTKLKTLVFRYQRVKNEEKFDRRSIDTQYFFYERAEPFTSMEYLDISGNGVGMLSWGFNEIFPKLIHLYASDNTREGDRVYEMTCDFHLPETLTHLHLERNGLRQISQDFNIENITGLFLDGNLFASFQCCEDALVLPNAKNLKILSLSHCRFYGNIDHSPFVEAHNLLDLNLSFNNIMRLEPGFFNDMPSLKNLTLDHNLLRKFSPPDFPMNSNTSALTGLSISYNIIEEVCIKELPSLRRLSLRANRITKIGSNCFSNLIHLEQIDLAMNRIHFLPGEWSWSLIRLYWLDLSWNFFTNISTMSIDSKLPLKHLFIRNNSFNEIEEKEYSMLSKNTIIFV